MPFAEKQTLCWEINNYVQIHFLVAIVISTRQYGLVWIILKVKFLSN